MKEIYGDGVVILLRQQREWLFWLQCSMTKIIKMTTTREWNIHDKRLWLHRPFQANYYAVIQFALTVNAPKLRSSSRLSLCIIQKTFSYPAHAYILLLFLRNTTYFKYIWIVWSKEIYLSYWTALCQLSYLLYQKVF